MRTLLTFSVLGLLAACDSNPAAVEVADPVDIPDPVVTRNVTYRVTASTKDSLRVTYLYKAESPEDPFIATDEAWLVTAKDGLWELTTPYYEGMKGLSVRTAPNPNGSYASGQYTVQILIDGVVVQEDTSPEYTETWGIVADSRAYSVTFGIEGYHEGRIDAPPAESFFIDGQSLDRPDRVSLWNDGYLFSWRSKQVVMKNDDATIHYEDLPAGPRQVWLVVSQGHELFVDELRLRRELILYRGAEQIASELTKVLK